MRRRVAHWYLISWSLLGLLGCGGRSRTDGELTAGSPAPSGTSNTEQAPCPLCAAPALLCNGPLESNDATQSALTDHGCRYESAGVSLQIECPNAVTCEGGSCGDISTSDTTITVREQGTGLGFTCWPDPSSPAG